MRIILLKQKQTLAIAFLGLLLGLPIYSHSIEQNQSSQSNEFKAFQQSLNKHLSSLISAIQQAEASSQEP